MATIGEGVKDLLVAAGVGDVSNNDWIIKIGRRVDLPHRQINIYETGGAPPNPKWRLDFPTFMVSVRGGIDEYQIAWSKIKDVKDTLLGIDAQDVNGDRWDGILAMGDIAHVGYDEQNRPMFTMNFRMYMEPAASVLDNRESL